MACRRFKKKNLQNVCYGCIIKNERSGSNAPRLISYNEKTAVDFAYLRAVFSCLFLIVMIHKDNAYKRYNKNSKLHQVRKRYIHDSTSHSKKRGITTAIGDYNTWYQPTQSFECLLKKGS